MQASYGELEEPEAVHPGQNERRLAASAHYSAGRFAAMAAYSVKDAVPGRSHNAWIAKVNWDISGRDSLFGRIENVANPELFPDHADPLHDRAFRATQMQLGYARRFPPTRVLGLTFGASGSAFAKPAAFDAACVNDPFAYTLFARISVGH